MTELHSNPDGIALFRFQSFWICGQISKMFKMHNLISEYYYNMYNCITHYKCIAKVYPQSIVKMMIVKQTFLIFQIQSCIF